jgi:dolichyl-phosphate-mannose--protein O-mannosyl transferase
LRRLFASPFWAYVLVAAFVAIAIIVSTEVLARSRVELLEPSAAFRQTMADIRDFPVAFGLLVLPFLIVGYGCSLHHNLTSRPIAIAIAVMTTGGLAWLYLELFEDSLRAVQEKAWTAAALTAGFRMIYGVGVAGVYVVLAHLLRAPAR